MKDLHYPWAHLLAELLQQDIQETKALENAQQRGDERDIELYQRLADKVRAEYKAALKEWVALVLRYDPKQPLIQMHREAISILVPNFVWPESEPR